MEQYWWLAWHCTDNTRRRRSPNYFTWTARLGNTAGLTYLIYFNSLHFKDQLFVATKRFVVIKNLQMTMADCSSSNKFEDNVMTVEYVPLEKYGYSNDTVSKMKEINEQGSFSTQSSLESSSGQSSDLDSLDKDIQAGTSMDTVKYSV